MKFVADENFPRPALEALRNAGWEVFSVAEERPRISDEEVAALCSASQRVLLTFDKDFGELVFHRGLSAGSGVVLFRLIPESPEEAVDLAGTGEVRARPHWDFLRHHTGSNSRPANAPCAGALIAGHDGIKNSYMLEATLILRATENSKNACDRARGMWKATPGPDPQ